MISEKKTFKVTYSHLVKTDPAICRHCFLKDQNGLKEFNKKPHEEYLCEIILKLGKWFLRRRFQRLFFPLWLPWQPELCMEQSNFKEFMEKKQGTCLWNLVKINLALWFSRCYFKENVDNRQHTTVTHPNSSPISTCAQVSYKKKHSILKFYHQISINLQDRPSKLWGTCKCH